MDLIFKSEHSLTGIKYLLSISTLEVQISSPPHPEYKICSINFDIEVQTSSPYHVELKYTKYKKIGSWNEIRDDFMFKIIHHN